MNPLILLILLPLLEIWVIAKVGAAVGAGWTVLLLLGAAALGVIVLQRQGLAALGSLPRAMSGASLAQHMIEKLLAVMAGVLLILPGFITDAIALALLFPQVRRHIAQRWLARATVVGTARGPAGGSGAIEGEARRVDD